MDVKVTDIKWDTTNEGDEEYMSPSELGLPDNTIVKLGECREEEDIDDYVCDALSDTYGFLVESFEYEVFDNELVA